MDFDRAFDIVLGHEGEYSNHPMDPGGATRWGITARVATKHGYVGDMRHFPRDQAKVIYRASYWNAVRAEEMPAAVRYPLFDAAVNSGVQQATKWLQRAAGVKDDGVIGPMTIAAVARDPLKVAIGMTAHRLDFLTTLPTFGAFGKGWSRRIASVLKEATA
jgi:lysozyme family protein